MITQRWVKDSNTKQYHLLLRAVVHIDPQAQSNALKAWHSTHCGLVVPGDVFNDGLPSGADCIKCLQAAQRIAEQDNGSGLPN